MEEWKIAKFDNPQQLIQLLNCLHLKKENILYTDTNKSTGEITLVYYY